MRGDVDLEATLDWDVAPAGAALVDAAGVGGLLPGKEIIVTGVPATRFAWGVRAYSLRARRGVGWFVGAKVTRTSGDPYFDFDGPRGDDCLLYPLSDGCLRTPRFEEACRGVADLLYFLRLEWLCKRTAKLAPREHAEARRLLDRVVAAGAHRVPARQLKGFRTSASEHIARLVRALTY